MSRLFSYQMELKVPSHYNKLAQHTPAYWKVWHSLVYMYAEVCLDGALLFFVLL